MTENDGTTTDWPARFGRFVSRAAREAGYDIDSPRGGGKKALAEDAGMSQSSVSRMLAGLTIPDPRYFEPLAQAVHVDLRQVLVEAGVISEQALDAAAAAMADREPLTAEQAADRLGITIPTNVQLFVAMVENMQRQESRPKGRRRGAA